MTKCSHIVLWLGMKIEFTASFVMVHFKEVGIAKVLLGQKPYHMGRFKTLVGRLALERKKYRMGQKSEPSSFSHLSCE